MSPDLNKHHFRRQEFNDSLSSRFMDEYLKTLDSSKSFFLASDIAEFEKYRNTFDDDFKAGKLANGFAIYNRLSERLTTRLTNVIALLDDKKTEFNFDKEENFNTDRKNASWPASKEAADQLWMQNVKASLLTSILNGKSLDESRTNCASAMPPNYVT